MHTAPRLLSRSIPPRRTSLLVARRSCEERSRSGERHERESEFLARPSRLQCVPKHPRGKLEVSARTHARTHATPRSRTTRILPPPFLDRSITRSFQGRTTFGVQQQQQLCPTILQLERERERDAVNFVSLSLPVLPPRAKNIFGTPHSRTDLVFFASACRPRSLHSLARGEKRRRGTNSLLTVFPRVFTPLCNSPLC